jgi:endonuclease G
MFQYLNDETLQAVRTAAVKLGFDSGGNLAALAAGISPAYIGGAMVGPDGNTKLLTLTASMNQTRSLVTDEVPLEKWLNNAIMLAAGNQQELVFREALERMAAESPREPGEGPDVAAAPRTDGGSLEIQIDEEDTLGVGFLLHGAIAARSVAKLRVHRHFDGNPSFRAGGEPDFGLGTGWLIGPNLAITNYHVINARAKSEPDASPAEFELQGKSTQGDFDDYDGSPATMTVPGSSARPPTGHSTSRCSGSTPARPNGCRCGRA